MPALDIPFFGTLILSLTLISASYTMAMAMGAGQGRPQAVMRTFAKRQVRVGMARQVKLGGIVKALFIPVSGS